jgi:hypothetical protein
MKTTTVAMMVASATTTTNPGSDDDASGRRDISDPLQGRAAVQCDTRGDDYSYGSHSTNAGMGPVRRCLWALGVLGSATGEEFFAGYLVEQSLSVDNLFVF